MAAPRQNQTLYAVILESHHYDTAKRYYVLADSPEEAMVIAEERQPGWVAVGIDHGPNGLPG